MVFTNGVATFSIDREVKELIGIASFPYNVIPCATITANGTKTITVTLPNTGYTGTYYVSLLMFTNQAFNIL